jgi:branched-chain amino acid aminotransferase
MIVFLDGQYLPAEEAMVSIFDRSFLYGDGLFETVPVYQGCPFLLEAHWARLARGAQYLRIGLPFSQAATLQALDILGARNGSTDGVARLTLSRGTGARGYSPQGADRPVFVISWHPPPEGVGRELFSWRVICSTQVVSIGQQLTRFKTANKLSAVLARAEADAAGAQDALILNSAVAGFSPPRWRRAVWMGLRGGRCWGCVESGGSHTRNGR